MAHCPASNAKLASGVAPLRAMLDRGIRVGLGTDGPASNDGLDLLADARLAALLARLAGRSATALTAAEAFWLATGAAADAIGRPDLGQLTVGRRADLVHVDTRDLVFEPVGDPADLLTHLVWSGAGRYVRDVWVGGRPGGRRRGLHDRRHRGAAGRRRRPGRAARGGLTDREISSTNGLTTAAPRGPSLFFNRKVEYEEDDVAADPLSRVFSALADPTRRDIVARLAVGDATVNELAAPYDVTVQAVSKHLKVLEDAGLVSRSREAQRRPVHLEANVFDLMTKWIERYRRQAEERYRRLDDVLRAMPDAVDTTRTSPQEGTPS